MCKTSADQHIKRQHKVLVCHDSSDEESVKVCYSYRDRSYSGLLISLYAFSPSLFSLPRTQPTFGTSQSWPSEGSDWARRELSDQGVTDQLELICEAVADHT